MLLLQRFRCSCRQMRAFKNPVRCLAVPDQGVAREFHAVLHSELHKRISRRPVIAILARAGMDVHPLHLVLGHYVIELRLHQRPIRRHLLHAAPPALASGHAAVHRCADLEIRLVGLFERGGILRSGVQGTEGDKAGGGEQAEMERSGHEKWRSVQA